jgi:hypothetical protein
MKKISILIVCLMSSALAFPQVQKGSMLAGVGLAGIGFNHSDSKTSYSNTTTVYDSKGSSFSFNVNPTVAWFIKDGLAVGGSVSFGFSSSDNKSSNSSSSATSTYKSTSPSISIGPWARYYFGGSEKGMPFVDASIKYGIYGGTSTSTSSTGSGSETKTKPKGDFDAGLNIGYEHFISEYIGIYGSVGLSYGKSKTDYDYKPSTGTGYTYTSEYSSLYVPVVLGLQVHIPVKGAK